MKRLSTTIFLLFFLLCGVSIASGQGRFMRDPDVNGGKIVFSYEGDLWIVATSGSSAPVCRKLSVSHIYISCGNTVPAWDKLLN